MAMMKSSGDKWSPYRRPRLWRKGVPGDPFKRTLEDEEDKFSDTMSLQLCPNHIASITSRRYPQPTELKALAISSFRNIMGDFAVWTAFTTFFTYNFFPVLISLL